MVSVMTKFTTLEHATVLLVPWLFLQPWNMVGCYNLVFLHGCVLQPILPCCLAICLLQLFNDKWRSFLVTFFENNE